MSHLPHTVAATASRHVLVVDDEGLIRWSLREVLTALGCVVSEARDGRGALRALTTDGGQPDVVLLDFRLPDSDDLRLLEQVIALAGGARVVLMTAHGTPELERGALACGAFRVLHKPFEMDDVVALLD